MMATLLKANQARGRAKVAGGVKDFTGMAGSVAMLMLNDKGMIRDCNEAAGRLFGCQPSQLVWQHISMLLPQLAETVLMQGEQINPRLRFLSRIGHRFEVATSGSAGFASELFFHSVESSGRHLLRVLIRPAEGEARYCGI